MPTIAPTTALPPASALILRRTRTAADFVYRHSRSRLTRGHAADVLRAVSDWHAADPESAPARLANLLASVVECTGESWLRANAADPDVARFNDLVAYPPLSPIEAHDLDDLLSTILWTRHAPGPAAN